LIWRTEPRRAPAAPIRPPRRRYSRVETAKKQRIASPTRVTSAMTSEAPAPCAAVLAATSTRAASGIEANRESTTWTRSIPIMAAACSAELMVPLSLGEMWIETTSSWSARSRS